MQLYITVAYSRGATS